MFAGTALAALGGTGQAAAATRSGARRAVLPPVGRSYTLGMNAFGTTMLPSLAPPLPVLDFAGSRTLTILAGGTDFVRYEVTALTLIPDGSQPGPVRPIM